MIVPYMGEFLLSTVPLECSLNYCSHKCFYCFANLNKPDRKAAPTSIINLLSEFEERSTLEAQLLQRRYPVLLSNKVDPFAASNWELSLQIIELLCAKEIPVAFQTKGGKGIEETLGMIGSSAWYISITCESDEDSRRYEPGAPVTSKRLALAEQLLARGHHVAVALNPLVRQWVPDPHALLTRVKNTGCDSIWIELMHLSADQKRNLTPKEIEAAGPEVLNEASKRTFTRENIEHFLRAHDACDELGLKHGSIHWPGRSEYYDGYAKLYPRRFPTFTEFTDWCWKKVPVGTPVWFEDFWRFCEPHLPPLLPNTPLERYITSCNRSLQKTVKIAKGTGWREMLKVAWNSPEYRMFPSRSFAFEQFQDTVNGELTGFRDDEENVVFRFTGSPVGVTK